VLVEAQLAAGADHARQLGQRGRRVADAAQERRRDARVHRGVLEGEALRRAVDDADGHRCPGGRLAGEPPHVRLGLDRHDLGHRLRIVGEVDPAAGADLDDPPAQPGEHPAAVLDRALAVGIARQPRLQPREHRVLVLAAHSAWTSRSACVSTS
jgi:hypothetical protein